MKDAPRRVHVAWAAGAVAIVAGAVILGWPSGPDTSAGRPAPESFPLQAVELALPSRAEGLAAAAFDDRVRLTGLALVGVVGMPDRPGQGLALLREAGITHAYREQDVLWRGVTLRSIAADHVTLATPLGAFVIPMNRDVDARPGNPLAARPSRSADTTILWAAPTRQVEPVTPMYDDRSARPDRED